MTNMNLHPEINFEAGELLDSLDAQGWHVSASMYEATFSGDWFVDLCCGERYIRLIKESEKFTLQPLYDEVAEDRDEAQQFDDIQAFKQAVAQWGATRTPASFDSV